MYATGDVVKTRQSTPYDHVPGWQIVVAVEVPASNRCLAPALRRSPLIVDLSRIYAALITHLGCLAFESQGAFASQR